MGESVELGEGRAALGPQRLRPVQHLRNPPLLGEGWERDVESSEKALRYTALPSATGHLALAIATNAKYLVTRDNDLLELMFDEVFRTAHPNLEIVEPAGFSNRLY